MVYLLKMMIFHGYVSHNQMVINLILVGERDSPFLDYELIPSQYMKGRKKVIPQRIRKTLPGLSFAATTRPSFQWHPTSALCHDEPHQGSTLKKSRHPTKQSPKTIEKLRKFN